MLTSSSPSNDCRFLQVCYVTGAPLQLASRLNGFFRNFFFFANLLRKRIRGLKQKLIFLVKFGKPLGQQQKNRRVRSNFFRETRGIVDQ